MHTITIKSIPDDLYAQLKESARKNNRSLNQEILLILEQALGRQTRDIRKPPRDPQKILQKVGEMQERMNLPYVTNEFIDRAKREDRE